MDEELTTELLVFFTGVRDGDLVGAGATVTSNNSM